MMGRPPALIALEPQARRFLRWLESEADGQMEEILAQDPTRPLSWLPTPVLDRLLSQFSIFEIMRLATFPWPPSEQVEAALFDLMGQETPYLLAALEGREGARAWVATLLRSLLRQQGYRL